MRCSLKTVISAVAAALAAPGAAQAMHFELEPETGSVWVSTGTGDYGEIVAEWRADGDLVSDRGAFNPFAYHDGRLGAGQGMRQPVVLDGRFGVLTDYRGLYRRDEHGRFVVEPAFGGSGRFGCHAGGLTTTCFLGAPGVDRRGLGTLLSLDEAGVVHRFYLENGAYREARGVEAAIAADDNASLEDAIWSSDGQAALGYATYLDSGKTNFPVYTAAGRTDRSLTVDGAMEGPLSVFETSDGLYVMIDGRTQSARVLKVLRLTAPFTAQIALEPVASIDGEAGGRQSIQGVGVDATHYYYHDSGHLMAAATHGGAAATELAVCADSVIPVIRTKLRAPHRLWVGCGTRLLRLDGGVIAEERATGGGVQEGDLLIDADGHDELVVRRSDGAFERLRDGKPNVSARLLPVEAVPAAFALTWEEARGPCGLVAATAQTQCRIDGHWQPVDLGLGKILDVKRLGGQWWAVGASGTSRIAYRRADGQTWQKVGEWAGDGVAKLVQVGMTGVGIDLGVNAIAVFDGTAFVDAFDHPRLASSGVPAVAVDDLLYDLCPVSGAADLVGMCAVHRNGAVEAVAGWTGPSASRVTFVPLARGILAAINDKLFVLRGTRAIAMEHLYGEFSTLPNQFVSIEVANRGDGVAVLTRFAFGINTLGRGPVRYYEYDGRSLNVTTPAPARHPLLKDDENGSSASIGGRIKVSTVWRGADGLWRAPQSDLVEPLSFGDAPIDALARHEGVAPDFVNDALVAGDRVLLATDDGLWQCPLEAATRVGADTAALPQTRGCSRALALPSVHRVVWTGDAYLIEQGHRILRGATLESAAIAEISAPTAAASGLVVGTEKAAWLEETQHVLFDLTNGQSVRLALPVDAGEVVAVAEDWLCAKGGLYHRGSDGWRPLSEVPRCAALTALEGVATVVGDDRLWRCGEETCSVLAPLPRSFQPGGALGELPTAEGRGRAPALTLGNRLYRFDAGPNAFVDVTPTSAGGVSLILTAASRLEFPGLIPLQGGGVVLTATGSALGETLHLRVE